MDFLKNIYIYLHVLFAFLPIQNLILLVFPAKYHGFTLKEQIHKHHYEDVNNNTTTNTTEKLSHPQHRRAQSLLSGPTHRARRGQGDKRG